jgi:hypothetical protein
MIRKLNEDIKDPYVEFNVSELNGLVACLTLLFSRMKYLFDTLVKHVHAFAKETKFVYYISLFMLVRLTAVSG